MTSSAAMEVHVKRELMEQSLSAHERSGNGESRHPVNVIDLDSSGSGNSSSSDSDDSGSDCDDAVLGKLYRVSATGSSSSKKQSLDRSGVVLPAGFLDPILPESPSLSSPAVNVAKKPQSAARVQTCKQFWKAGDYEGGPCSDWESKTDGMDHVRVHPKFLHSNATSHKWALGAFAELLDNALDEVCNGATYVNLDMVVNKKDGSPMLLIEDNGGGMDPDKMRHCMSLGYSAKSKIANTIGQYGNGFKTSTMRLGADVIVFSRSCGKDGKSPSQSIGLLSYTFLRSTGKEDIVVPILDYERIGIEWQKMMRFSAGDWNRNVETIVQWSPYSSEANLLQQFNLMKDHGTRIIIYNLWEDDQGRLELDFDSDRYDIQISGVNRDEKNIQMAKEYPNSRHFLTYRHSVRSYVSILYLRLSPNFRIILRGKDVEHHNVVNDMMLSTKITYRPQAGAEGVQDRDPNMVAVVTIGFVKDAESHIDVQGFNVYHKNRLIKPFWRVWNAAGSDGRGVIGVLEANFVEPAHDKQGFERTTVLARLEAKLVQLQKTYWSSNCHLIGYAPRRNRKEIANARETSPEYIPCASSRAKRKLATMTSDKFNSQRKGSGSQKSERDQLCNKGDRRTGDSSKSGRRTSSEEPTSPSAIDTSDFSMQADIAARRLNGKSPQRLKISGKDGAQITHPSFSGSSEPQQDFASAGRSSGVSPSSLSERASWLRNGMSEAGSHFWEHLRNSGLNGDELPLLLSDQQPLYQLKEENCQSKGRGEEKILDDLLRDLQYEKDKCKSLETRLEAAECKIIELKKEQESLIDTFSRERDRRDIKEEYLRKKLEGASNTIQELHDKVRLLESLKSPKFR